jgi:hypothetical protein
MDAVRKSFQNAIKTFSSRFTSEDLEKFRFLTIDDVRSVLAAFQEDAKRRNMMNLHRIDAVTGEQARAFLHIHCWQYC